MFGISKGTIVRTAVLILALVNTSLQLLGYDVLPFGEEQLETAITVILNLFATMAAWYKNNSFTKEAQEADKYLKEMKKHK